jgi:uncharacterized membrane protein
MFEENFQKVISLSDEKVQLAVQSYETLDKAIRLLDDDLQKFTHLLKEEQEKKVKQIELKQSATVIQVEPPKNTIPLKKKKRERTASITEVPVVTQEKKKRKRVQPVTKPPPLLVTNPSSIETGLFEFLKIRYAY